MIVSAILILILVTCIYFMLIWPERRKQKKQAVMLNSIEKGNILYTKDGVRGRVEVIEGRNLTLSCFPDGTKIRFDIESVSRIEDYDEVRAKEKMKEKIAKQRARQASGKTGASRLSKYRKK